MEERAVAEGNRVHERGRTPQYRHVGASRPKGERTVDQERAAMLQGGYRERAVAGEHAFTTSRVAQEEPMERSSRHLSENRTARARPW
jgi:hypothetical protein